MRNKENSELINDSTNKQMVELDKIVLSELEGLMDSKTLAMRYFYHDMLYFVNIEQNAANYLVDRLCRTSWNLTDQYISAIIDVAMWRAMNGYKKMRMSVMHNICFGNLHEDTVGEATLYHPNKVLAHLHAFLF